MNRTERGQARPIRLRNYVWALVILWTTAFAVYAHVGVDRQAEQNTGRIAGRGTECVSQGSRPVAVVCGPRRRFCSRPGSGANGTNEARGRCSLGATVGAGGCFRHDP